MKKKPQDRVVMRDIVMVCVGCVPRGIKTKKKLM